MSAHQEPKQGNQKPDTSEQLEVNEPQGTEPAAEPVAEDEGLVQFGAPAGEDLEAQLSAAQEEIARYHEELLRARAEVENVRRSEEHTSELQSRPHLVCRLLREKKKHNHQVRAGLVRGCGAVERRAEVGRGSGADGGREAGEDDLHGGRALEDAELAGDRECAAA